MTFGCVGAKPDDTIKWTMDGEILPAATSYWKTLYSVTLADQGLYRCYAYSKNSPQKTYSVGFDLTILAPHKIRNIRIQNVTDSSVSISWNSTVYFNNWKGVWREIDFRKGRDLEIVMTKIDSQEVYSKGVYSTESENDTTSTIEIGRLLPKTLYSIYFSNKRRIVSDEIPFVTLASSHQIWDDDMEITKISPGARINLHCGLEHLENYPIVQKVCWTRRPSAISRREFEKRQGVDLRYQKYVDFKIESANVLDLGIYECRITFSSITVERRSSAEEPPRVAFRDYTRRISLSFDDDNISSNSTLYKPMNVQCVNITQRSMVIRFESPDWIVESNRTMMDPSRHFQVRYWLKEAHYEDSGTLITGWPKMEVVARNLHEESIYAIQVVAVNEDGEGEATERNCLTESIRDDGYLD